MNNTLVSVSHTLLLWLVYAMAVATTTTCRTTSTTRVDGPTAFDRLVIAYPDLRQGRFSILADFEEPAHQELFHVISASGRASIALDIHRKRESTGAASLAFTTSSESDTLIAGGDSSESRYLVRDWRPFDLFLIRVHSPQASLVLDMTIAGGAPSYRMETHTKLTLQRGWNAFRLDLAEVGENVPLDDIRELRFTVSNLSKTATIQFDDLILTRSRETLLGDPADTTGELYVERVGRRWRVGANGPNESFELAFANGRIVAWYNIQTDPHRLSNLVAGTTLGPCLEFDGAPEVGVAISTRTRIVELNRTRVVIASQWQRASGLNRSKPGTKQKPFERWIYAIYPSGQVYYGVEAMADIETELTVPVGLAVRLAVQSGEPFELAITQPDENRGVKSPYAVVRNKDDDALLLYVPYGTQPLWRIEPATSSGKLAARLDPPPTLLALHERTPDRAAIWAAHLYLGSSTTGSDESMQQRAVQYSSGQGPTVLLGTPVQLEGMTTHVDGFDPTSGCFVIRPDHGRVRLLVGHEQEPIHSPVFLIRDVPMSQDVWVYVDHLIFTDVARSASGDLLFQIPGVLSKPTLVEVHVRISSP